MRTPQLDMQDDVPQDVKMRRLNEAIHVYKEVLTARNQAEVSCRHLVLVEGPSRRSPSILTGRTCTGKRVFMCDEEVSSSYGPSQPRRSAARMQPGDYVAVDIISATGSALQAKALGVTSIAEFVDLHGSTVVSAQDAACQPPGLAVAAYAEC